MPLTDRPRDMTEEESRAEDAGRGAEQAIHRPDADFVGVALVDAVLSLAAEVAALRVVIDTRP